MTYAPMNVREFASTRETSIEIALAIFEIATEGAESDVWTAPTGEQAETVVARAWQLADADETDLHWGNEVFSRVCATHA